MSCIVIFIFLIGFYVDFLFFSRDRKVSRKKRHEKKVNYTKD